GECVAMFLGNEPAYVWLWLGLAKLGCAMACLNCNIRGKSLLHCFQCCGAKVLLASPGLPKAAMINHLRVWYGANLAAASGITENDVVYTTLPLYHSAALLVGLHGCILTGVGAQYTFNVLIRKSNTKFATFLCARNGATVVLRAKFSASQFWDDCRKYNVTIIQYIGCDLLTSHQKPNDRDHKVRMALGNGLRGDVWREFIKRFGDIHIYEFYASTEGNIGFMNYTRKVGAVGRVNYLQRTVKLLLKGGMYQKRYVISRQKVVTYELIKYDVEKDEPVRDGNGYCIKVPKGEVGLLVCRITQLTPFSGYAGGKTQTEKKKLRDVFKKGDLYFNSGDLLMMDHENFIYFHDRVGDTFRWKGENVATTEVADIVGLVDFVQEVNVYGVSVPGHEGRIGMASIKMKEDHEFDGRKLFKHVADYLPNYARPRFLRIQDTIEITGTFKHRKVTLMEEGFNPAVIKDALYFLDDKAETYVPMTEDIYNAINDKTLKL
ncbi:hypothetical protein E2I00_014264, partial [Balaenoptera physalus]